MNFRVSFFLYKCFPLNFNNFNFILTVFPSFPSPWLVLPVLPPPSNSFSRSLYLFWTFFSTWPFQGSLFPTLTSSVWLSSVTEYSVSPFVLPFVSIVADVWCYPYSRFCIYLVTFRLLHFCINQGKDSQLYDPISIPVRSSVNRFTTIISVPTDLLLITRLTKSLDQINTIILPRHYILDIITEWVKVGISILLHFPFF